MFLVELLEQPNAHPCLRINRSLTFFSFVIQYRPNTFSSDEMCFGKVLDDEREKEAMESHKREIEIAKKKGRFFHGAMDQSHSWCWMTETVSRS